MTSPRVALVTGAGRGLGRHTAMAFARAGYRVVASARIRAAMDGLQLRAASEGLTLNGCEIDLTRYSEFPRVLREIVTLEGGLHVIVNCAGVHHFGAMENVSADDLDSVMMTNFVGPLMLFRAAIPYFRRQGGGRVLAASSLSGLAGTACDGAYAASKHALEGAIEALSHEVDRWNVHFALLYFGRLDTDMMHSVSNLSPSAGEYQALEESVLRRHRDAACTATSACAVAAQLPSIAEAEPGRLRWACDTAAERVFARLGMERGSERDTLLREVDGTTWWRDGETYDPDNKGGPRS